jgi:hypothetical protein
VHALDISQVSQTEHIRIKHVTFIPKTTLHLVSMVGKSHQPFYSCSSQIYVSNLKILCPTQPSIFSQLPMLVDLIP